MSRASFIASILGQPRPPVNWARAKSRCAIQTIGREVCADWAVSEAEMFSNTHRWPVAQARQEAYRRAHSKQFTIADIRRAFNRDHSTVSYGIRAAQGRLT